MAEYVGLPEYRGNSHPLPMIYILDGARKPMPSEPTKKCAFIWLNAMPFWGKNGKWDFGNGSRMSWNLNRQFQKLRRKIGMIDTSSNLMALGRMGVQTRWPSTLGGDSR